MRDDMFFGTSILHWFWRGLGRGLGSQNRCFSHIFRCFFDVKIEVRFGTRKNWFKIRKKQTFPLFGAGFAVPGGPWGERKRERGTNFGRRISKKNFKIIPKMPSQSPARRCPPRWGGGLKTPQGGEHRRPPIADNSRPNVARYGSQRCWRKTSCDLARSRQILGLFRTTGSTIDIRAQTPILFVRSVKRSPTIWYTFSCKQSLSASSVRLQIRLTNT